MAGRNTTTGVQRHNLASDGATVDVLVEGTGQRRSMTVPLLP
jgi:hypothetical protein